MIHGRSASKQPPYDVEVLTQDAAESGHFPSRAALELDGAAGVEADVVKEASLQRETS